MKNINTFFAAIFSFFLAITATSVLAAKTLKNKNNSGFCEPCDRSYKNIYSHKKHSCPSNPNRIPQNHSGFCKPCGNSYKSIYSHKKHSCPYNHNRIPRNHSGFCVPCGKLYINIYYHRKRCKNLIRPQAIASVIGKVIKKSKIDLPKLSKTRTGRKANNLIAQQQRKVQKSLALRPIILNSKTKEPPKNDRLTGRKTKKSATEQQPKALESFSMRSIMSHLNINKKNKKIPRKTQISFSMQSIINHSNRSMETKKI